jgi:7,8-dihydropterin-6-yl-methyl-4-(beta-D-ribofuranosyl)aminobenzene 5'-phosphate synthase
MASSVQWARISVLVENLTDMLLPDDEARGIKRFGLVEHFRPPHGEVVATENGISYWIEVGDGDGSQSYLFDAGLTGRPCLQNVTALGLDLGVVDKVVISHAHPDHFGGLMPVLERCTGSTQVVVHPDAFLRKLLLDEQGEVTMVVNEGFERDRLEAAGAEIVDAREPVELGQGVVATGEIPREESFEPPVPVRPGKAGLFLERDGDYVDDEGAIDDQAVIINVDGHGLVVLTACGHSGIVNTVRYAQRITGVEKIAAIMGGFHLGFPGVSADNVPPTVSALKAFAPELIAPMHCTGFHAQTEIARALPDAYVQNVVGTTITFGS